MLRRQSQDADALRRELEAEPSLIIAYERSPLADFRCTDLGNASAFAERNSDRLKYCHALDAWFVWDSRRWKRDADGGVYRLAEEYVLQLYAEASHVADERRRKEIAAWAIRSEDRRKIDAMLALAKHQSCIVVTSDDLDSHHWLLTVANGTVDLRSGKLLPHDPAHLITKLAPVDYDPTASGPVFRAFLDRTFNGDADTTGFVQKAVGYSLTGDTSEQCLLLCHGSGANGKSTFLSAVQFVLGDYALATPTDTLLAKRDAGGIPNDVARLQGSRFVSALETEDGKRLAESRIKTMTGGDRITARYMRGEWFEFDATFKLWLATNHKPEIQGADHATWRRIRLIPFTVTIPDDERDPHLLDKLKAEASAILAWAVAGCLDWQRDGLRPSESVACATAEYRSESDVLGAFLEECCSLGDGFTVKASQLYSEYKSWADRNGESLITNAAFGRRMVERGFTKKKTKSGILYNAIGIATGEGFGPGE